jgi:putative nucleotidyltransferase with HDIG domain
MIAFPVAAVPREIQARLVQAGFQAYYVGGCVRDWLRGVPCADVDIATNAGLDDIARLFPRAKVVGEAFSVALVEGVEVATFRQDGPYSDFRHPDYVRVVATIDEDLSRRDFTFNAMALGADGVLIDPFGGQRDVAARLVRFVGAAAQRLREDPIRACRACRFAALIGGTLDEAARVAMQTHGALLDKVPRERIQLELNKILLLDQCGPALHLLEQTGLLPHMLPRVAVMVGVPQNIVHAEECWTHTVACVAGVRKKIVALRLAALLHDIGKPVSRTTDETGADHFYGHEKAGVDLAEQELRDLRYSNEIMAYVHEAIAEHLHRLMFREEMRDSTIRRLMSRLKVLPIRDLLRLQLADLRANFRVPYNEQEIRGLLTYALRRIRAIEAAQHALKITDLCITGADVMQHLGVGPGPQVGAALRDCFERVLQQPELNTRADLLNLLQRGAAPPRD